MSDAKPSPFAIWGPFAALHLIGLPLAGIAGYFGAQSFGPANGTLIGLAIAFLFIGLGIWHLVRMWMQ